MINNSHYDPSNKKFYYSAVQLRNKLDSLITDRSGLNWFWNNVLNLVRPSKQALDYYSNRVMSGAPDLNYRNIPNFIYDNQGSVNSLLLASYLHSNLTNPHDEWMTLQSNISPSMVLLSKKLSALGLEVGVGAEDQSEEEKEYIQNILMQACGDQMHLTWRGSNFHQEIFMFYKSLVDIGTACLGVFSQKRGFDEQSELSFVFKDMRDVYFAQDSFGFPNHVFAIYKWTAREVIDYFARGWSEQDILSVFNDRILKAYKNWSDDIFTFVHAVYPDYSQKEKFLSSYFMYEYSPAPAVAWQKGFSRSNNYGNFFLKNEIINYNPYLISRIRKEGMFGVGFSAEAYPLLIQVQDSQRSIMIGSKKNVEPAVNVPGSRLGQNFSTAPNAKNPMEIFGNQLVSVEPSMSPVNIKDLVFSKQELKMEIDKIYLIDKIIIEQTKRDRTATEVEKRTGEEIKILSPFVGSLEAEFLNPLGRITFNILKNKRVPFVSDIFKRLAKTDFGFKYVSDIAMAQTYKKVQRLMELWTRMTQMAEKDPEAKLQVEWGEVAKLIRANMNVSRLIEKSPQAFKKDQEAMKKQLQQAQQSNMMSNMKDIGSGYKSLQEGEEARLRIEGVA